MYSHPALLSLHRAALAGARDDVDAHVSSLTDDDDAAVTPPEWVHLIPAGIFSGRDGRGPYELDAEAVIAAWQKGGLDLPIDYEHQTLEAEAKAGPVPAAGWIDRLEARADGLWGRVRWTDEAARLIAGRAYRYLSPVFRHAQGRVVALLGAGLVHYPNLDLTPVANQMENPMDDLMERLVYMLNLPVTATADEVAAELQKLIDRLKAAETAAQAARPDPAEWVPMSQHKTVADTLARLQAEIAAARAAEAVDEAMRAGKLAPALKDWAQGYAEKDLEAFRAWAEKAPVIVGTDASHVARNAGTEAALTDEDRLACSLLGIAEAEFAAHKSRIEVAQ